MILVTGATGSVGRQVVSQLQAGDVVRWPYGQAGRSLIHEADIATVAVAALTQDGHAKAASLSTRWPPGPASWTGRRP
jgi:hypothetical protein